VLLLLLLPLVLVLVLRHQLSLLPLLAPAAPLHQPGGNSSSSSSG
jgi:hypothetical protein